MCNSAVQCGSKKAQSFGMDESTIEYLELKWRRQSPRVFLRGGASVQRLRLLRRGVRSPRINHTTLYINSWQSEYKFSFSLYFKYLVYFIFGNNWVNVLDTDKETLIFPCYLYRFFSNCFQRYRIISIKWPELKENWLHFRLLRNPAVWK